MPDILCSSTTKHKISNFMLYKFVISWICLHMICLMLKQTQKNKERGDNSWENQTVCKPRKWRKYFNEIKFNVLMHLRDMKYIGFRHQRENKQISVNAI
jgi:hypothetical protein